MWPDSSRLRQVSGSDGSRFPALLTCEEDKEMCECGHVSRGSGVWARCDMATVSVDDKEIRANQILPRGSWSTEG